MYESHITVSTDCRVVGIDVADTYGWKTSEIARDPLLGDETYFYLTSHDKSFIGMYDRMKEVSDALRSRGVEVVREKIELIVYDTKTGVGI